MKLRCFIAIALIMTGLPAFSAGTQTLKQQSELVKSKLKTASGANRAEMLLAMATLQMPDSVAVSLSLTQQAVAVAAVLPDSYMLAKAYTYKASLYLRPGMNTDSASACLRAAAKAFDLSLKRKPTASYYYQQARYHSQLDESGKAMDIALNASEAAAGEGDYYTLGLSQKMLASLYLQQGNFQMFADYLARATQSLLQSDDRILAAPAMISLGVMYNDAGMHDKGDRVLLTATRLCEQTGDSLYLAYLYCNVAGIYYTESPGETLDFYNKAVAIFSSLKNDRGSGYALNLLGSYYAWNGKSTDAVGCFNRAIEHKTRAADWQGACFAACNLAEVFMNEGDQSRASAVFGDARVWMRKAGDKLSEVVYNNSYAKWLEMNKLYDQALGRYLKSLACARELMNQNFILDNLKAIAKLYELKGSEAQAVKYYQLYIQAADSLKAASGEQLRRELVAGINSSAMAAAKSRNHGSILEWLKPRIPLAAMAMLLVMAASVWAFGRRGGRAGATKPGTGVEHLIYEKSSNGKSRPVLNGQLQQAIWQQLQQLMLDEKYYLNSDLSLNQAANMLKTNTSYLSKVINEEAGLSFTAYVNRFRVEEACRLLTGPAQQHLSIEGIAISAGFNSKSAFNAAFKKFKGLTPSEFVESQQSHIQ